jgi:hypothetical protein
MKQTHRLAVLFVLALASTAAIAQTPAAPAPAPTPAPTPAPSPVGSIAGHPGWPVAKPEDVSSPEAILNAVYSVISGPKGQARDWDRMRSLFIPDGRLIPAKVGKDGHTDAFIRSVDQYIARNSSVMMTSGFFERSLHNEFEQFGNIVQIWSTYESRHNADDAAPFDIMWDDETPAHPIPAKYLPN